jgi:hypothetical protein
MKRLHSFKHIVFFGLVAALPAALAFGCKKSSEPSGAVSASASASAAPIVLTPPPGADADLFKQLVTIVEKCKINVDEATASCPGEEARKLGEEFSTGRRSRVDAVRTFALALASEEPKMRAAATAVLHSGFRSNWGAERKPGDVKAEDADALLKAVVALPKSNVRRALPAAVHASILANRSSELYAELDKSKEPEVASVGYRYVMTHGRLDAFPKIQEVAKSTETRVALSAIESVQNMEKWTEAEQAAICPWATQFLSDQRPSVAARASSSLSNCGGKFLDEILSGGEKALKEGTFASARLTGLRSLCTPARKAQANSNPPTDAQCERARSLLEKVVQAPKLDVATRSSALVALTNQWNDARTLAFVKRLQASKAEGLTEQLKTALRRLERKDPVGPGSGSPPHPAAPRLAPSARTPG